MGRDVSHLYKKSSMQNTLKKTIVETAQLKWNKLADDSYLLSLAWASLSECLPKPAVVMETCGCDGNQPPPTQDYKITLVRSTLPRTELHFMGDIS